MKFLVAFVGLFAVGNAATVLRLADPAILPSVVSPGVIPSVVPYVSSIVPTVVPATELSDWEAYKTKFGKTYVGIEDRFRRNVYYAYKQKIAKYDELIRFGIEAEKLELDSFADFTRDELFNLRSLSEEHQTEWDEYKVKYNKNYDSFEDRFRKTVYFIVKDTIIAHNKLVDRAFVTYRFEVNAYTDYFHDELGSGLLPPTGYTSGVLPATRLLDPYPYPHPITYPLTRSLAWPDWPDFF